jgi:hypothetical protein
MTFRATFSIFRAFYRRFTAAHLRALLFQDRFA